MDFFERESFRRRIFAAFDLTDVDVVTDDALTAAENDAEFYRAAMVDYLRGWQERIMDAVEVFFADFGRCPTDAEIAAIVEAASADAVRPLL